MYPGSGLRMSLMDMPSGVLSGDSHSIGGESPLGRTVGWDG